jgi:hypothetical protein
VNQSQVTNDLIARLAEGVAVVRSGIACDAITVLKFDTDLSGAHRVYSTILGFPESVRKPMPSPMWKSTIAIQNQPMFTCGESQLKSVFPDYKKILDGGHVAVLNLPVVLEDRCIGSVNCLFEKAEAMLPSENRIRQTHETLNSSSFPNALHEFEVQVSATDCEQLD